jgi:hypothetical protein
VARLAVAALEGVLGAPDLRAADRAPEATQSEAVSKQGGRGYSQQPVAGHLTVRSSGWEASLLPTSQTSW